MPCLSSACLLGPAHALWRETMACAVLQEDVETWMLLEYCDRGALSRAVERGKLKSRSGDGGPDLVRPPFSHQTFLECGGPQLG